MYQKRVILYSGLLLILPGTLYAASGDQYSHKISAGFSSTDIAATSDGNGGKIDGRAASVQFGYQYYFLPVKAGSNVPLAEAAFVQRSSSISAAFSTYTAELDENGNPGFDVDSDGNSLGYVYSKPGFPFAFSLSAGTGSTTFDYLGPLPGPYLNSIEDDSLALSAGYFPKKTLLIWASTSTGDEERGYTDARPRLMIENQSHSLSVKYLKLLGNQSALSMSAAYVKYRENPDDTSETTRSTLRGGAVTYYFNQSGGASLGYVKASSSDPADTGKTVFADFHYYVNTHVVLGFEYSKDNMIDPESFDTSTVQTSVSINF